ncbi:histone deacetylase superfamily [Backusella circina FSU 941]|nr:histone deacetylase superfamily [Backusella circina FSU 941]
MRRRLLPTGYVYDVYMSFHATPDPTEIHPEDPRRIFKIYNRLAKNGILDECLRIKSRMATKREILLVHTASHYQSILDTAYLTKRSDYMALEKKYNSIYLNANSFESALYAAGCLIELVHAVCTDTLRNALAIIRPPGHHAEIDTPMGFCLFNNVAVATQDALERGCRRILILDWDVHFGNGTQAIFAGEDRVLYMSLHRYDDGHFYPHDVKADVDNVGLGAGRGTTVNIPWPCAGMTDADYMYAFRQVVMPIASEFDPELVIVSAGFDAAIHDPIGLCKVTPAGYGQMTHQLKTLANGKLVVALEGGYDLNSTTNSALACMQVLLGEAPQSIDRDLLPQEACIKTVKRVKQIQSAYWRSCI